MWKEFNRYLCHPACETMPGHAGGGQGLLSDQQELRQRRAGAGKPLLWGQDDGGIIGVYTYYFITSKKVYLVDYT